jgi:hypothetical protein
MKKYFFFKNPYSEHLDKFVNSAVKESCGIKVNGFILSISVSSSSKAKYARL